jgi:hypothetical protein
LDSGDHLDEIAHKDKSNKKKSGSKTGQQKNRTSNQSPEIKSRFRISGKEGA